MLCSLIGFYVKLLVVRARKFLLWLLSSYHGHEIIFHPLVLLIQSVKRQLEFFIDLKVRVCVCKCCNHTRKQYFRAYSLSLSVVASSSRSSSNKTCSGNEYLFVINNSWQKWEARYIKAINKEIILACLVKLLMTMLVCLMCFDSLWEWIMCCVAWRWKIILTTPHSSSREGLTE
jgi:hypothetical protein